MLRDAPTPVSGGWHYQRASNVTDNGQALEFCTIEKVGTKHWRKLFCHLQNKTTVVRTQNCWHQAVPTDAPRAVFLRDPLERFLSAYMDKCLDPLGITERHCEPNIVFLDKENGLTEGLEDKKLRFEAYVETMPLKWNLHFFPQR